MTPPKATAQLVAGFSEVDLQHLDGIGHMMMMEAPDQIREIYSYRLWGNSRRQESLKNVMIKQTSLKKKGEIWLLNASQSKLRILMFARAIGDSNLIYSDDAHAAGTEVGSIIAPPTFAQASAQFDPDYFLRPKDGQNGLGAERLHQGHC